MAIKVGLGAFVVPSASGAVKPSAAQPAKVLVWRQPARPAAGGSNIFQPKIPQRTTLQMPGQKTPTFVPQRLLPPQKPESQLPFRPAGKIDPPKATTGMPQRQPMKQPTFGNWPKTTAAVPAASAKEATPTSEQAVSSAPTGRTVTAAADALPQDKPNESAGGAYVDTTGSSGGGSGGEIVSAAEEAVVTAENAVKTEAAAVAQTGRAGLGWVAGVGVAIGAYLYLRRKK